MADDFLIEAWQQRVNDLISDQATLNAHLVRARADGDHKTAADAIEGLNEADVRLQRLQQQRARYETQIAQQPAANKFGLTPDEQDAARVTGVSEEQYASGKVELMRRKAAGFYPDGQH